jgi:hypothetical protein
VFQKRESDFNPGRFWRWFGREAQGIANGMEALARGEAEAEWMLIGLNERLKRYDASLTADVCKTLDGQYRLSLRGEGTTAIKALMEAAPALAGWRISTEPPEDLRRMPFKMAPRPSLDAGGTIEGLHEAWA